MNFDEGSDWMKLVEVQSDAELDDYKAELALLAHARSMEGM